jgi:hypothetical protein
LRGGWAYAARRAPSVQGDGLCRSLSIRGDFACKLPSMRQTLARGERGGRPSVSGYLPAGSLVTGSLLSSSLKMRSVLGAELLFMGTCIADTSSHEGCLKLLK